MTPDTALTEPPEIAQTWNAAPTTAGMTTKVIKGSLWTIMGQVAPLGISLVTTPFVIRMLGAERYGVLILVGLIPGYLGFADFGMSIASTKFASEAYAEGDIDKEGRIIRTSALIALCSSLPIAAILFAASPWISTFFNVPEALLASATLAFRLAAITFVLTFLNGIFNTPQLARLRMDLNSLITGGFRILGLLATPFAVYYYGVVGAVFVLMIASLLTLCAHIAFSARFGIRIFEWSLDRASVSPMLKYGRALASAGIAGLLLANLERGLIPRLTSVAELGYYSVAFTIAAMLTLFSSSMSQSLIPAFARLAKANETEQLNALYARALRINLALSVPILVVLALIAHPLLSLWAGSQFASESLVPFYILLAGLAFHTTTYLPYSMLLAVGRTDTLAKIYWLELLPYAIFAGLLIYRLGAVGAAIAWSTRIAIDNLIMLGAVRKIVGITAPIKVFLRILLISSIFIVPLTIFGLSGGLSALVVLLSAALMVAYVLMLKKFVIHADELNWVVRRFNILFAR